MIRRPASECQEIHSPRGDSARRTFRRRWQATQKPAARAPTKPLGLFQSPAYDRTWQATQWPREISFRTCSFSEHDGIRIEQRVWKRHPEGGLMGLGTSPSRMIRLRFTEGSGIGTAERSASVYGCLGLL